MKNVIDTNVVIPSVFFGGYPRRVLDAVLDEKITVSITWRSVCLAYPKVE